MTILEVLGLAYLCLLFSLYFATPFLYCSPGMGHTFTFYLLIMQSLTLRALLDYPTALGIFAVFGVLFLPASFVVKYRELWARFVRSWDLRLLGVKPDGFFVLERDGQRALFQFLPREEDIYRLVGVLQDGDCVLNGYMTASLLATGASFEGKIPDAEGAMILFSMQGRSHRG